MTPYEILGLSPDATPAEIRSRYHKLILQCHPDRSDSPDAADRTQAITEAYQEMMGRGAAGRSSPHRVKKQAAKYHRKDPKKKGRAARKAAHRAAKTKKPRRVGCKTCRGSGTFTTQGRSFFGMRRSKDVQCPDCSGRGYVMA